MAILFFFFSCRRPIDSASFIGKAGFPPAILWEHLGKNYKNFLCGKFSSTNSFLSIDKGSCQLVICSSDNDGCEFLSKLSRIYWNKVCKMSSLGF